jgi:hypothetical protein
MKRYQLEIDFTPISKTSFKPYRVSVRVVEKGLNIYQVMNELNAINLSPSIYFEIKKDIESIQISKTYFIGTL